MLYEARIDRGNGTTFPVVDERGVMQTFDDPRECYRWGLQYTDLAHPLVIWRFNERTGEQLGVWKPY